MKIYIGADHNGFGVKQEISNFLQRAGYTVEDVGNTKLHPDDDFPEYASMVATTLLADGDPASRGILICGSGQGMCIAANRFKGIRASLCWNLEEARASRNDDDSNVLCLTSRYLNMVDTKSIVMTWLNTPFAGAPRFTRRIQQLDNLG
ncbi:MAG TPA: RpiB/LacA/LacB family sugar-phosphate isomerase [Candidatus Saccharimonadales bacterium]|nr:RpiB/LacA/LacB family sugar-phosphate isomerase [Candidatus Saccharimonadales bacterium]